VNSVHYQILIAAEADTREMKRLEDERLEEERRREEEAGLN
jgi:hypothetical protein